ncbi:MAG: phenylalanine--tRNA ligase subunit beta [Campylobacterota bacterium]|nr:phenylalanine--tRNA ligase subunit beta [Campylobacterota bacterium]
MIVTRSWLNEWIDLSGISTEELAKTFNAIGLEVDRTESCRVPEKIVVGKVLECESHPDADKLSVCQVDIGSSVRQIVCGAKNVRAGLSVAVAVVGAQMPGGLKIKPVKLRGVDSAGMICSSTELGLPKLEDGIMELDESIGKLELGSELAQNSYFNDDLIEIELTANRGDCLSIRGIARDLSAAFNRPLKNLPYEDSEEDSRIGIGRILQLSHTETLNVDLNYRAIELKNLKLPMLFALRLAQIEEEKPNDIESLLFYATYNSGVIMRAYHYGFFADEKAQKAVVTLNEDEKGYAAIYGNEKASTVGIIQYDVSRVSYDEGIVLLEASYIPPDIISRKMHESKIENGPFFYRTSRGSEPDLQLGMNCALGIIDSFSDSKIFGGTVDLIEQYEERVVSVSMEDIHAFIGATIEKKVVTQLLKNLGFDIKKSTNKNFVIEVPRFRHDIVNTQDIIEEIVRMVGIDNIPSKPFAFSEENRLEDDYFAYKKRRVYRHRAAQSGFYESVHFVFEEQETLNAYGFECVKAEKALLNPIVNTMDTLRPTLTISLLRAASQNVKVGQNQVTLFEVGSVFSAEREESVCMTMLFSGDIERDKLSNGGKPAPITLDHFVQKVADIIGDFDLQPSKPSHNLAHPFQCADIMIDGQSVGELYKLHPNVQESFDLNATYLCELDFDALPYGLQQADPFSKFQASFRDLSLLMPSAMAYSDIEKVIEAHKSDEVIRFYPVDRYSDEKLGDEVSLSLRFVLQSPEKTLEEEDITSSTDGILKALQSELGLTLR